MATNGLDNGDVFMRAVRAALPPTGLNPQSWTGYAGPAPGEREAEDVTGLRLLEEFLAKRKGERDGDERK
jgi:hypothetical protein